MAIELIVDPPLTDKLRGQIVELWVSVTNAGGAVGFVPPVDADRVRPVADKAFSSVEDGFDRLVVAVDGDELVGILFIVDNRFDLMRHWRVVKRVMVSPARQGGGVGAALMRRAEAVGREMGLIALEVTVRAGHGRENFYAALGYRETGRRPGALRVAPGDDRDEITMWLTL